ncbi:MAG: cobaltochelatase subunit CobN [Mangrovicoccus sp.]|nr:cobaltochelatase subunit CobN [Mangrovicoccus sp.]
MHLLAATPGAIEDGAAVDLGQTPAELVVLSAADSELAGLSEARAEMAKPPGLRLASLLHLRHPMSVDEHISNCALGAKLVVARVLGGTGYWRYGLEQYSARLGEAGISFAALPGDDKPDEELWELSNIPRADWEALWAYMVEGGPENAQAFLEHAAHVIAPERPAPPPARPLLRAGLYWPGQAQADLESLKAEWQDGAPVVPLVFYRALLQGAGLHPINRLVAGLSRAGLNPLPIFVASLKDPVSQGVLEQVFTATPPDVILNCTAFAVGSPGETPGAGGSNPLAGPAAQSAPVFQVVLSGLSENAWEAGAAGLGARDIAMNVALPEVDGRVMTRAVSFKGEAYFDEATQCPITTYRARGDRIAFVAELAAAWARLRHCPASDRQVALVLANYPNRDGRLANGVGLDTPAATVEMLHQMSNAGYGLADLPHDAAALMQAVREGPTNWLPDRAERHGGARLSLDAYLRHYHSLPLDLRAQIEERWGAPEQDPFVGPDGFALSILRFGNVTVGVQPARGYNIDPEETYHSPDLVPPHNYLAFYFWLRFEQRAHAVVHMGKHGNLEWLPGKAVALSENCLPEAVLGPMPHIYPFIVNDPGEGTQAKRRTAAVIIDHLTPPLTRAESYGPLRDLEALVDEYYEAAGVDPRRIAYLRREIVSLCEATGLGQDAGMTGEDEDRDLARLDAWLCELKEAQIRDGLHIFGQSPKGRLERDLALALLRLPRGNAPGEASLTRALAADLGLEALRDAEGVPFDPLDCDMAKPWDGPRPEILAAQSSDPWRSQGDTVERLELLALACLDGQAKAPGPASAAVLEQAEQALRPAIAACGPAEAAGLLTALDGRFVAPGPSGAPTRGRPDTLPTGRNFFSVDSRAVPTRSAWSLGWKSANLLIERHLQDHGDWPRSLLLTAWGTANMRTGGDDIAQALALMGVRPQWDSANRRVTGFEIIPHTALGRPRVDVTLRVSGFFRDAFPQQIALVDSAARAVMALDEPDDVNPAAARARSEGAEGQYRVFGAKPGAYGAGLQAMIDERLWSERSDLGEAYLTWGSYAYGAKTDGVAARSALETRLSQTDAIVQNQDNREHDLLDSDDYYQFEGGAAAAIEALQGEARPIYHNDHSRPERPVIRSLDEEIARVVRSRAVNPKWIEGVKRHGYKGAFEIAATVDYLFAFAATTGAVRGHHFDAVYAAYLEEDSTRDFLAEANPDALREIAQRLEEAIARGLWQPRSNSARALLDGLRGVSV